MCTEDSVNPTQMFKTSNSFMISHNDIDPVHALCYIFMKTLLKGEFGRLNTFSPTLLLLSHNTTTIVPHNTACYPYCCSGCLAGRAYPKGDIPKNYVMAVKIAVRTLISDVYHIAGVCRYTRLF